MDDKHFKWALGIFGAGSIMLFVTLIILILVATSPDSVDDYNFKIQRENIELMYDGARADLVQCIDSTIRVYAPTTCMNGLEILRQCEKYNVDLFFVLAQGQIESHFGTKGMALRTNSVFNVYAYDGYTYEQINKKGKYPHPDLSIEPYLRLLTERYLVNGKTEMDLMNNYVDKYDKRYASSEEYEFKLTTSYQQYITNKELMDCYKQYVKCKILAGK